MTPVPNYEYQVGGSLPVDAPSYVSRQADEDFYQGLKAGKFCYVLNARQMGKSSLRVSTIKRLEKEGYICGSIDLEEIGVNVKEEQWYAGMVRSLVSSCQLSEFDLRSWWKEQAVLSPLQRLGEFIEEVLLVQHPGKIIIFIDEIDSILSLKFSTDDFFSLIQSRYNKRADDPKFKRLTFGFLGVATPSDLIRESGRKPFNIGSRAIELGGFEFERTEPLIRGLRGLVHDHNQVMKEILKWTGGQPLLTQRLCKLVVNSSPPSSIEHESEWVEKLVQSHIIENWTVKDEAEHLRTIRDRILNSEEQTMRLLGIYQQVLEQGAIQVDDSIEQLKLQLSGLVIKQQGQLVSSNRIYQSVFNVDWVSRELGKLRPYDEPFQQWINSKCQDTSCLLQGQALEQALKWAAAKSLTDWDLQFLAKSQEIENQKNKAERQMLAIENQKNKEENIILSEEYLNLKDKQRKRGILLIIVAVISLVSVSILASLWPLFYRNTMKQGVEEYNEAIRVANNKEYQRQKFNDALAQFRKAGLLHPFSKNVDYRLGQVYEALENVDQAAKYYKKGVKANHPGAYSQLAWLYIEDIEGKLQSQDSESPIKLLKDGLDISNKEDDDIDIENSSIKCSLLSRLGLLEYRAANYTKAEYYWRKAIDVDRNQGKKFMSIDRCSLVYCSMAQLLYKQDNYTQSQKNCETCLEKFPPETNRSDEEDDLRKEVDNLYQELRERTEEKN